MTKSTCSSRSTRSTRSGRSSKKCSISSSDLTSMSSWTGSSDSGASTKTGYTVAFNRHPLSGSFSAPKQLSPPRTRTERKQHRRGKHSAEEKKTLQRQEQACIDAIASADATFKKAKADADMAFYKGIIDIKTAMWREAEAKKARDRQVETMQAVWRGYRKTARTNRKLRRLPVDPVEALMSERLAGAREAYEEAKSEIDAEVHKTKLAISERWSKKLITLEGADREYKAINKKMEPEYTKIETRYEEHKKYIKDTHFYPEAIRKELDKEWKAYMKELKRLDKRAQKKKNELLVRWHRGLLTFEAEVKKEELIQKRLARECRKEKECHEQTVADIKDGKLRT